jgi:acetylornithine aminotransferase
VTTGIGRTGSWFGFQHYGISPDVVAMGKGLGNGYPVSAASFGPAVIERLGGREIRYAQSHQNDPLGAAVAREVIRTIREERLIERGREAGAMLADGLRAMLESGRDSGRIRAVRARGPMIAVALHDDAEGTVSLRTHRELLRRGYIVARRAGMGVLRIDPPLTIEAPDIQGFLRTLEEVLAGLGG